MEKTIVLVGFQDQGNLGIGYLAAVLRQRGHRVEVADFRSDPEALLRSIRAANPILVGFSVIFQYFLPDFAKLAQHLRDGGIDCHFTAGGHYPSLCHDETLQAMPQLDSVVRFEGEFTLLELVECLAAGRPWSEIQGLAYCHEDGRIQATELRPAIRDLDELPYPYRYFEPEQVLGRRTEPILASRGCARTCSFCSIHTFYRAVPGKIVRTRRPSKIVEEMKFVHETRGITVFLFQDDDFPMWGKVGRRWVTELADEIHRQGLAEKVIWKISCRVDYVEAELFSRLRDAGLYLVYMGLESGNEEGLEVLHKQVSVARNEEAVAILKDIGLMFEYGFMLFDPSTTFESIHSNVTFLRRIVGDGSAGAVFCRMLPYGGTPIRERLAREGRLKGDVVRPDYDFLEPAMNGYFHALDEAVRGWIHGHGVSHQINWAWHEVGVMERLFPPLGGLTEYRSFLRELTRESNGVLFDTVEESASLWQRNGRSVFPQDDLDRTARGILQRLLESRNEFVAMNQRTLLATLASQRIDGPIVSPQIF